MEKLKTVRTRTNNTANEIEAAAKRGPEEELLTPILFSSGSTELNLACSDTIDGAFIAGTMINIIGDSFAGKTMLAHSIMAEAAINPKFNNYRFIYDNPEAANTAGIALMFGKALAERIEILENCSNTVQEFQVNAIRTVDAGPCIYILDSFDAITSDEEEEKMNKRVAGKEVKGSMGMEKAKNLKALLRTIVRRLKRNGSLLIIISQTIQNVDMFSFQEKKRAGGEALKFFAAHEIWLGLKEKHVKKTREKDFVIGAATRIRVTKNRITGKMREAELNIYYDYGIDDIGTIIDFMVERAFWNKNKNTIAASDLQLEGTREKLIAQIEEKGLEQQLKAAIGEAWGVIEEDLRLNRKKKYE